MGECGHDFAAQMEAIDDGGCSLCLKDAIADLERRLAGVMVWLTRHQPAGSPPPGDEVRLAGWIVADLESSLASLDWARAMAEALVLSHEGHIARLEEEKAQWPKNEFGSYLTIGEYEALKVRLAQAEAREAAMLEAWVVRARPLLMADYKDAKDLEAFIGDAAREMDKAVSPDAGRASADNIDGSGITPAPPVSLAGGKTPDSKTPGAYRALAAEVKTLREVERAAQNVLEDLDAHFRSYKSDQPQLRTPALRNALAVRGEEGE